MRPLGRDTDLNPFGKVKQYDKILKDVITESRKGGEVIVPDSGERDNMYPFMTLIDETEITHSEKLPDGRVKVYIETPDEKDCFHHMTIYLPDYEKRCIWVQRRTGGVFYKVG